MPHKRRIPKLVACLTLAAFLVQEPALAVPLDGSSVPQAPKPALSLVADNPADLAVPFEFVALKEIHPGTNGRFIIHVQDAHANLSGQQNAAAALESLMKSYGVSLIFVEGGDRDVTLDDIRKMIPAEGWKIAAKRLLYEGIISGHEYLSLVSDEPLRLIGVEYAGLYMQNLEAYAALVERRKNVLLYIHGIRNSINRIKNKLYPKELIDYEAAKDAAHKKLFDLTKKAQLDLEGDLPEMARLRKLQEEEKSIDFTRAGAEQEDLVRQISLKGGPEAVRPLIAAFKSAADSEVSRLVVLNRILDLAGRNGVDPAPYAELLRYRGYLAGFTAIDFARLVDEMDDAENRVYKALLISDSARKVRAIDRYVGLVEKGYNIQLSSKEFDLMNRNKGLFGDPAWQAFLNDELRKLGYAEDLVPYRPFLEEGQASLESFYDLVSRRDFVFMENIDRVMTEKNQKAAFLVTGGYHTQHLAELMRDAGYGYVVLSPIVTMETDRAKYEELLLAPLEEARRNEAVKKTLTRREGRDAGVRLALDKARLLTPDGIRGFVRYLRESPAMREFLEDMGLGPRRFEEALAESSAKRDPNPPPSPRQAATKPTAIWALGSFLRASGPALPAMRAAALAAAIRSLPADYTWTNVLTALQDQQNAMAEDAAFGSGVTGVFIDYIFDAARRHRMPVPADLARSQSLAGLDAYSARWGAETQRLIMTEAAELFIRDAKHFIGPLLQKGAGAADRALRIRDDANRRMNRAFSGAVGTTRRSASMAEFNSMMNGWADEIRDFDGDPNVGFHLLYTRLGSEDSFARAFAGYLNARLAARSVRMTDSAEARILNAPRRENSLKTALRKTGAEPHEIDGAVLDFMADLAIALNNRRGPIDPIAIKNASLSGLVRERSRTNRAFLANPFPKAERDERAGADEVPLRAAGARVLLPRDIDPNEILERRIGGTIRVTLPSDTSPGGYNYHKNESGNFLVDRETIVVPAAQSNLSLRVVTVSEPAPEEEMGRPEAAGGMAVKAPPRQRVSLPRLLLRVYGPDNRWKYLDMVPLDVGESVDIRRGAVPQARLREDRALTAKYKARQNDIKTSLRLTDELAVSRVYIDPKDDGKDKERIYIDLEPAAPFAAGTSDGRIFVSFTDPDTRQEVTVLLPRSYTAEGVSRRYRTNLPQEVAAAEGLRQEPRRVARQVERETYEDHADDPARPARGLKYQERLPDSTIRYYIIYPDANQNDAIGIAVSNDYQVKAHNYGSLNPIQIFENKPEALSESVAAWDIDADDLRSSVGFVPASEIASFWAQILQEGGEIALPRRRTPFPLKENQPFEISRGDGEPNIYKIMPDPSKENINAFFEWNPEANQGKGAWENPRVRVYGMDFPVQGLSELSQAQSYLLVITDQGADIVAYDDNLKIRVVSDDEAQDRGLLGPAGARAGAFTRVMAELAQDTSAVGAPLIKKYNDRMIEAAAADPDGLEAEWLRVENDLRRSGSEMEFVEQFWALIVASRQKTSREIRGAIARMLSRWQSVKLDLIETTLTELLGQAAGQPDAADYFDVLFARLQSNDNNVRYAAGRVLARLGVTAVGPLHQKLEELLVERKASDRNLAIAVVQALGRISDPSSFSHLEAVYDWSVQDNDALRPYLFEAMGRVGGSDAAAFLTNQLSLDLGDDAAAALQAVAEAADAANLPSVMPLLVEVLGDGERSILDRSSALFAILFLRERFGALAITPETFSALEAFYAETAALPVQRPNEPGQIVMHPAFGSDTQVAGYIDIPDELVFASVPALSEWRLPDHGYEYNLQKSGPAVAINSYSGEGPLRTSQTFEDLGLVDQRGGGFLLVLRGNGGTASIHSLFPKIGVVGHTHPEGSLLEGESERDIAAYLRFNEDIRSMRERAARSAAGARVMDAYGELGIVQRFFFRRTILRILDQMDQRVRANQDPQATLRLLAPLAKNPKWGQAFAGILSEVMQKRAIRFESRVGTSFGWLARSFDPGISYPPGVNAVAENQKRKDAAGDFVARLRAELSPAFGSRSALDHVSALSALSKIRAGYRAESSGKPADEQYALMVREIFIADMLIALYQVSQEGIIPIAEADFRTVTQVTRQALIARLVSEFKPSAVTAPSVPTYRARLNRIFHPSYIEGIVDAVYGPADRPGSPPAAGTRVAKAVGQERFEELMNEFVDRDVPETEEARYAYFREWTARFVMAGFSFVDLYDRFPNYQSALQQRREFAQLERLQSRITLLEEFIHGSSRAEVSFSELTKYYAANTDQAKAISDILSEIDSRMRDYKGNPADYDARLVSAFQDIRVDPSFAGIFDRYPLLYEKMFGEGNNYFGGAVGYAFDTGDRRQVADRLNRHRLLTLLWDEFLKSLSSEPANIRMMRAQEAIEVIVRKANRDGTPVRNLRTNEIRTRHIARGGLQGIVIDILRAWPSRSTRKDYEKKYPELFRAIHQVLFDNRISSSDGLVDTLAGVVEEGGEYATIAEGVWVETGDPQLLIIQRGSDSNRVAILLSRTPGGDLRYQQAGSNNVHFQSATGEAKPYKMEDPGEVVAPLRLRFEQRGGMYEVDVRSSNTDLTVRTVSSRYLLERNTVNERTNFYAQSLIGVIEDALNDRNAIVNERWVETMKRIRGQVITAVFLIEAGKEVDAVMQLMKMIPIIDEAIKGERKGSAVSNHLGRLKKTIEDYADVIYISPADASGTGARTPDETTGSRSPVSGPLFEGNAPFTAFARRVTPELAQAVRSDLSGISLIARAPGGQSYALPAGDQSAIFSIVGNSVQARGLEGDAVTVTDLAMLSAQAAVPPVIPVTLPTTPVPAAPSVRGALPALSDPMSSEGMSAVITAILGLYERVGTDRTKPVTHQIHIDRLMANIEPAERTGFAEALNEGLRQFRQIQNDRFVFVSETGQTYGLVSEEVQPGAKVMALDGVDAADFAGLEAAGAGGIFFDLGDNNVFNVLGAVAWNGLVGRLDSTRADAVVGSRLEQILRRLTGNSSLKVSWDDLRSLQTIRSGAQAIYRKLSIPGIRAAIATYIRAIRLTIESTKWTA